MNATPPHHLLGSHVSAAGGFVKALERAESIECLSAQLFVKGNTRWEAPLPDPDDAKEFRRRLRGSCVRTVIAHSIYLVNLASPDDALFDKSVGDMIDELQRCAALGIAGLVVHPGSHGGSGTDAGVARAACGVRAVLKATARLRTRILLETTAGQGASVGCAFAQLAGIIAGAGGSRRLGVCLDTCHVFAAGYDPRTRAGYRRMWREFDATVGRERLQAIHLNDSKKDCGARVDRHEHIGKGAMGLEPFRFIMNDRTLRGIPMILETEKDPDMANDRENLATLRSLVGRH